MVGSGDTIVSKPQFPISWNLQSSARLTSPSKQHYEVNFILVLALKTKTSSQYNARLYSAQCHCYFLRNETCRLHLTL